MSNTDNEKRRVFLTLRKDENGLLALRLVGQAETDITDTQWMFLCPFPKEREWADAEVYNYLLFSE